MGLKEGALSLPSCKRESLIKTYFSEHEDHHLRERQAAPARRGRMQSFVIRVG